MASQTPRPKAPKAEKSTVLVGAQVPTEVAARFKERADAEHRSVAGALRRAINIYLDDEREAA